MENLSLVANCSASISSIGVKKIFECGWVGKETTARTAAAKANDDQAINAANKNKGGDESELDSDEYEKAKGQGLGLIKCISELFKV